MMMMMMMIMKLKCEGRSNAWKMEAREINQREASKLFWMINTK